MTHETKNWRIPVKVAIKHGIQVSTFLTGLRFLLLLLLLLFFLSRKMIIFSQLSAETRKKERERERERKTVLPEFIRELCVYFELATVRRRISIIQMIVLETRFDAVKSRRNWRRKIVCIGLYYLGVNCLFMTLPLSSRLDLIYGVDLLNKVYFIWFIITFFRLFFLSLACFVLLECQIDNQLKWWGWDCKFWI